LALLAMGAFHIAHYSTIQNKGAVANGIYDTIGEITRDVGRDDLILAEDIGAEIKMALVYYKDKNVVSFHEGDLSFLTGETLANYNDIYLLFWHPFDNDKLTPANELTYRFGLFEQSDEIPEKYYYILKKLYLYKLDKRKWIDYLLHTKKEISIQVSPVKKEGFYPQSAWTGREAKISGFTLDISGMRYLKLTLYGYLSAVGYDPKERAIEVFVDGKKLRYLSKKEHTFYFELGTLDTAKEIVIRSKTLTPKSLGIGDDERELGLDIQSIRFIKEIPQ
jgi:hypothetical protein